jgi:hypothetical protein
LWNIRRAADGSPRFDLAWRLDNGALQEHFDVLRERLSDKWLRFIRVLPPRTGIEVVDDVVDETGTRLITFRDLRTGETSAPWRAEDLKEGSVREYAARMQDEDVPLNEDMVRWWGNIGYLRPMRSQVDLVYRDENGVDHVFYAARREELRDQWAELLTHWETDASVAVGQRTNYGESDNARNNERGRATSAPWRSPQPTPMVSVDAHRERHGRSNGSPTSRWFPSGGNGDGSTSDLP